MERTGTGLGGGGDTARGGPHSRHATRHAPRQRRTHGAHRHARLAVALTLEPICLRSLPVSSYNNSCRRSFDSLAVRNESTQ